MLVMLNTRLQKRLRIDADAIAPIAHLLEHDTSHPPPIREQLTDRQIEHAIYTAWLVQETIQSRMARDRRAAVSRALRAKKRESYAASQETISNRVQP